MPKFCFQQWYIISLHLLYLFLFYNLIFAGVRELHNNNQPPTPSARFNSLSTRRLRRRESIPTTSFICLSGTSSEGVLLLSIALIVESLQVNMPLSFLMRHLALLDSIQILTCFFNPSKVPSAFPVIPRP